MQRAATIAFIGTFFLAAAWTGCGISDYAESSAANNSSAGSGGSSTDSASGGNGSTADTGNGGGFAISTGTGMNGCNPESFVLEQAPAPEVYLVIDRSGSMNDPGATMNTSKWDEMTGAVDTALTQFESQINFGVLLYPAGDECATSGPQVAFAPSNRTAIMNALNSATPAGGTPTAAALNNAAASLKDFGSPLAPKVLVLATDGGPNCNYLLDATNGCSCTQAAANYCCTNYPGTCNFGSSCLDDQNTLDTINNIKTSDQVDTFVIGLAGTDEYKALLNEMAKEGGQPQMGSTTDYYAVTDQMSLSNALKKIAVSVISCKIELSMAPQFPNEVKVFVDGMEIPHDDTKSNGWDYTDDTNMTIELYGPACSEIQDGDEHQITATFECENN